MADGLCDWGDDTPHPRNHILTTLAPPATVELCDEHYGPGLIPLLAAELGVDPGEFYANVERYLKREQAKADKALAAAQAAEAAGAGAEAEAEAARNEEYATLQAEHLAAADLRSDWPGGDAA